MSSRAISKIDAAIKDLQDKKTEILRKQIWRCKSCGRGTQIGSLELLTVLYYVQPYSCTGGDYWTMGEYPEYLIPCPKCKKENRHYYHRYFVTEKEQKENQCWNMIHNNKFSFAHRSDYYKDK